MPFPDTMQAIAIQRTGGIDVIEKMTLPFPKNIPGNVLVKVQFAGINFTDSYTRSGLYTIDSFPQVLGVEASGTIVDLPTDEDVLGDIQYQKRGFHLGGRVAINILGVHAEYASVPWVKVYPIPGTVSLLTAGAALVQGLSAVTFMTESYNVKKGDYIFIATIAGGLGLLFCQLAKHRGAIVIGSTSTPEKAEIAKQHGADYVILYPVENTAEQVLEITNGQGVHAVFDGVGKDTFDYNFKMLRRKGTLVTLGNASGAVEPVKPLKLAEKNISLIRPAVLNYLITAEETFSYGAELFRLIDTGALKINIHKVYPFTTEGARQAQKDLTCRGGATVGKLMIRISDD